MSNNSGGFWKHIADERREFGEDFRSLEQENEDLKIQLEVIKKLCQTEAAYESPIPILALRILETYPIPYDDDLPT